MNKLGQVLQALIGIALVAFLFTGGYFLLNRLQPKSQDGSPQSTITPTVSVVPTSEDKNNPENIVETSLQVPEQYKKGILATPRTMKMPEGFSISVYAAGLTEPRFFDFDESGAMYLADKIGKLFLIKDNDKNGISDEIKLIDDKLRNPHSVDYYNGDLYSAEEDKIVVYKTIKQDGTFRKKQILINNLPSGKGHRTRTIKIEGGKMYVTIGSSCNVCIETDKRRAALVRYNLDGTNEEILAEGLRNTVGFVFHNSEVWSVDNGRDLIGDDIPPEEVNILTRDKHYGWPYCYGNQLANPEYPDKKEFCKTTQLPRFNMQAHSAPLGLNFIPDATGWPKTIMDDLLIAFHGSWNRTVPTGYKLVRIDQTATSGEAPADFITGWYDGKNVWGRPVGIDFGSDKAMYVSDDQAGVIYRVTYTPKF